jgi:hypothetical protein
VGDSTSIHRDVVNQIDFLTLFSAVHSITKQGLTLARSDQFDAVGKTRLSIGDILLRHRWKNERMMQSV